MREILQASSPLCDIPEAEITAHFRDSYAPKEGCVGEAPEGCSIPRAPQPPPLLDPVTPEEVAGALRRTSNTAPGPDGLRYSVWRRWDPTGHVLAAVFNVCVAARRFPSTWKISSTILIHKKGPTGDVGNWRPIALSNTAGKLLCSVLAGRLSRWTSEHKVISDAQKGFTPTEGCLEQNYVLQQLLDEARRKGSELCLAWLDLVNAFGSVPHQALFAALQAAGLTGDQIEFVMDLYSGSSTSVRHATGTTPSIDFRAGVRQGCPFSSPLFNLVMEFVIRPILALAVQHGALLFGSHVSVLAYCDDLTIVAKSEDSLRVLLDAVVRAAAWVGLKFKPAKCASLHVAGRTTRNTIFEVDGAPIRTLRDGDSYVHLGVPTGMKVDQTPVDTIARLEEEATTIFGSLLAPWQKLHAVRTFLLPQLDFNIRTARVKKSTLKTFDSIVKAGCKRVLGLPSRASAELVALPPSWGGAGVLPMSDSVDLAAVGHAFRLLTSPDPVVARMSLEGLAASAGQRRANRRDFAFLTSYLNADFPGNSNVATIFSSARAALRRLSSRLPDLRWGWSVERDSFQLTVPGERDLVVIDKGSRGVLSSRLRTAMQLYYRASLAAKPDQGRVARVTSASAVSNHMLYAGRYTRFADWRFLHRARLNVLPLNGCRRWGELDRRCRRCGRHDETTAHVLCHCPSALATGITRRHDSILNILVDSLKPAAGVETRVNVTLPLDQLVPGVACADDIVRCRPDIVVVDRTSKTVKIVDVTVPYEDGWRSVVAARERKLATYAPLAQALAAGGFKTSVDAFVVGSLGAWDNANWWTLARLGVTRRYGTSLARRCVSEAIRWSRDIYVTHVTGHSQYPPETEPVTRVVVGT